MKLNSTYRRLWSLTAGVLLILSYSGSRAQDKKTLSLKEAITLSIQNSKELKLSQAKIDAALASVKTANNQQLPDVNVSASYLRINEPNVDLKLKLNSDSSGSGGSTPKVNQVAYAMASVSVPIFSGFIIQSQKASAHYLAEAAKLDADKDREAIIKNTVDAYSNLYKSQQAVALVQENLKQQQQRVADFSNLEKNGIMARNDLLKAQLQESNVEVSLLEAESNLKLANISMNLLLGLADGTQLEIDMNAFDQPLPAGSKAVAEWEQLALQNRKDAAALDAREKAANAGIRAAKGAYYPSVAFTGGYVALTIPNVVTVTNALNAGIGVKYSASSLWKNSAKVAEAKVQLQEVKVNEQMLADNIHISVNKAYQDYLVNQKKIDMYQRAIDQSEENYKIVKNKQENNLATTTDLLEADVANVQAKLNRAFAKADAMVAYTKLLETAGVLNESGPVESGK
ncbi:Outer membrane protein TolC [Chitinophaga sp. CF118]|uniref:TolC family protein n=1 Tax=Chitinophaga sp. CF118 TaxID=1884367 RepID=UPI0008EE6F49|nr:TolC family protein [Chitinophaga sp. CF118]SFD31565.1 Outer membrane protein TolC [Chitinophaga sp. CF118]